MEVEAVVETLREKLPGHTFRAVLGRADRLPEKEREDFLRGALANRERDEEYDRERAKKGRKG